MVSFKWFTIAQSVHFYSPISKSKLKTFEHMNAKTSLKCKSGEIITGDINPEIVFRRALVLANSKDDVTIDNILSHPECLLVFFDRWKFLPVRNISAFYDLGHLCLGSHFGTTLSFSRLDGVVFVIPVTYISYCMISIQKLFSDVLWSWLIAKMMSRLTTFCHIL
jgi:hypothetical protein